MELIDQQVINDNKEIFAKIQAELRTAEFEILVATAWFTDDELFNILLQKLGEGVHIEIIVADNQENEKLNFDQLTRQGAQVYKIKNIGYGMMNQKFCVIDKRIALHGSYNWTVNARKNNHESIISTNHQETIESLIGNFNQVKTKILEHKGERSQIDGPETQRSERSKVLQVEIPVKAGADFEKLLDSTIAAEVGSFDRKLLREQGFERSKSNSGDHQVLHKAFDTVYSVFINDIDVIDDKKKRLIAKIEEHRIRTIDMLGKSCELQTEHLEREHDLTKIDLETRRTNISAEIDVITKNIEGIKSQKIPAIEQQNEELDQQIKNAEREFITPQFKWFELVPAVIFGFGLLVYLFIFYSSAAYILLFSVADARENQFAGSIAGVTAQVFNPAALGKALHKGGTAPFFIFLFVFIPLAFALIDSFIRNKWMPIVSFVLGILVLDGAVAYKVTEAVQNVNYLSGTVTVKWLPQMAFQDTNFYLVFIFGAFGLFLFKVVFKKIMQSFEDRNPDILMQRNKLHIKQLRQDIGLNREKATAFLEEASDFEKQIIHFKASRELIVNELSALPINLNREINKKKELLITDTSTIEKTAVVYVVHIQSDNLPISVDALKDRINVFLEGWNDYLFQEYAVARATAKTTQAFETATAWQNEKLRTGKVDNRLKFNPGE